MHSGPTEGQSIRAFTLNRLAYAYFGLSFLGIASFLFLVFCPRDVKTYGSVHAYIESERPLLTRNRMGLLLYLISLTHVEHQSEHLSEDEMPWHKEIAYPMEVASLFHEVFTSTFLALLPDHPHLGPYDEKGEPQQSRYFTDREEVDVWAVADIFRTGAKVNRGVAILFGDKAMDSPTDFLTIRYLGQDYARPVLRALVTLCYGLGFLILLIPTASTFVLILQRVLGL
jgi:hypothetical protein